PGSPPVACRSVAPADGTPTSAMATSTMSASSTVASVIEVLDGGDIASYQYGLDANPPTATVDAWNGSWGIDTTLSVTPPTDGPHTPYVRAQDRAGNSRRSRRIRSMSDLEASPRPRGAT